MCPDYFWLQVLGHSLCFYLFSLCRKRYAPIYLAPALCANIPCAIWVRQHGQVTLRQLGAPTCTSLPCATSDINSSRSPCPSANLHADSPRPPEAELPACCFLASLNAFPEIWRLIHLIQFAGAVNSKCGWTCFVGKKRCKFGLQSTAHSLVLELWIVWFPFAWMTVSALISLWHAAWACPQNKECSCWGKCY